MINENHSPGRKAEGSARIVPHYSIMLSRGIFAKKCCLRDFGTNDKAVSWGKFQRTEQRSSEMATGALKNLVTTTTSIGAGEVDLNKGRFGKVGRVTGNDGGRQRVENEGKEIPARER